MNKSTNKKCQQCGNTYNMQESTSVFCFQFCSEACEDDATAKLRAQELYVCALDLPITIVANQAQVFVREGTKWRRDEEKTRGLAPIHLENNSGNVNAELHWIEIDDEALTKHFQKIN